MRAYLLKAAADVDLYCRWSVAAGGMTWLGARADLFEIRRLATVGRIARADAFGCSELRGYVWETPFIPVHSGVPDGMWVLPRAELGAYIQAILEANGDSAAGWPLLQHEPDRVR